MPASRTDWIHSPLPFWSGFASSGESPQTESTMAASVTFSSARMAWEGRWKLAA